MIEVSGFIDEMMVGIDDVGHVNNKEELLCSMLDCPILKNGEVIGTINEIDIDDGIWYGVLWDSVALNVDCSLDNAVCSIDFVKRG